MAVKRRQIRHENLRKYLEECPFMTDEELAARLDVSVSTIRLDRSELKIPELRERTRAVADQAYESLRSLEEQEVIGHLTELTVGEYGHSEMLIQENMVLGKAAVARGHYLFAQANSLAIALVNAEMALTGSVTLRFIRPVHLGEMVRTTAKVLKSKGNRCWVQVVAKVNGEKVLEGEWVVFALQDENQTIKNNKEE